MTETWRIKNNVDQVHFQYEYTTGNGRVKDNGDQVCVM